jgi:hypothetical protein
MNVNLRGAFLAREAVREFLRQRAPKFRGGGQDHSRARSMKSFLGLPM